MIPTRYTRLLGIGLTLLVAVVAFSSPALANMAPRSGASTPAGLFIPGKETPVGVEHEILSFDFGHRRYGRWYPKVTVEYTLYNPTSADESLQVAFLSIGDASDFAVQWRGQPVNVDYDASQQYEGEVPVEEYMGSRELHWLNPVTGRRYAVHRYAAVGPRAPRTARLFDIVVPAGETGKLVVSFIQGESGFDGTYTPFLRRIQHYTYLLSPARGWAFFKDLEIRIQHPSLMLVATEPTLERAGFGRLQGRFDGLPDSELHISTRYMVPELDLTGMLILMLVYLLGLVAWIVLRARRTGRSAGVALLPAAVGLGLSFWVIDRFNLDVVPALLALVVLTGLGPVLLLVAGKEPPTSDITRG